MKINRYLDHTILKPELSSQQVMQAIRTGLAYDVRSICVRPCDIELAKELCRGTNTEVSCVLAFPHGTAPPDIKRIEAQRYIAEGVDEIDMVLNYSLIKSRQWDSVEKDIAYVASATHPSGVGLKVILETSQLTLEEIKMATRMAISAKADFIRTSTGFYGDGATVEQVQAILEAAEGRIKVKPSGGIFTRERAMLFLGMGVHRLGISYLATPQICSDGKSNQAALTGSLTSKP